MMRDEEIRNCVQIARGPWAYFSVIVAVREMPVSQTTAERAASLGAARMRTKTKASRSHLPH